MITLMRDGNEFIADDFDAIVSLMKRHEWGSPPKKREYMIEVAERIHMFYPDATVRTDNTIEFLYDLERAGVCTITYLTPEQAREFVKLGTGQ